MAEVDRDDEIMNKIDIEKEHGDEKISKTQRDIIDKKNIHMENKNYMT